MKVSLCRFHWQDFRRGQERCFLLTNGLGGYSSLTVIGDTARNDHALFMAAEKAPNKRARLISNVEEISGDPGEKYRAFLPGICKPDKESGGLSLSGSL